MSGIDGESWVINNPTHREFLLKFIEENKDQEIAFKIVRPQRTLQQNRGIYAFLTEVAEQLAAGGHDMKTILKDGVPIEPTKELVKKYMWMPVQFALTGKGESTSELNRKEVNIVYEQLSKLLAEKYGISIRFGKE